MPERKVLIVTYHYPPDAAVGALRPAKTARYLAELGWRPYVLTVKERYLPDRDDGRLADVQGIPVYRTDVWPTLSQLALRAGDRLSGGRQGRKALAEAGSGLVEQGPGRKTVLDTLRRYMVSIFELPDKRIGWLLPALWSGYRLIRREGIGLIVTSSPPPTAALVGLALSRLAGVRLVTDLRDPWFSPLGRTARPSSALSDGIERWLERQLMKRASRVVTTTEQYRQFLVATYPELPAERFCTIWNGYDPEDFAESEPPARPGTLTIAYLGTFYFGRTPREFLRAVAELVRDGAIARRELSIRFVGDVRQAEGESVQALASSYGLDGCVTIEGPVSHRQALGVMKVADVLLLLAPDQYYCIPAKAYEYIGARRPILCLAREGATAALIRQTGAGAVVEPDDVPAIKRALLALVHECRGGTSRPSDHSARYERRVLAAEFARVLEASVGVEPAAERHAAVRPGVPGPVGPA